MSAEILKGYRLRKGNQRKLIESVFALWKYSWMENGQLLAKKRKDHYLFLLSFLSEPEAERFEENFSQDGASQHLREFSPREESKDEYAPLGDLLPPKVMETLLTLFPFSRYWGEAPADFLGWREEF